VHVRVARHAIADPTLLAEVSRGIGTALRAHGARALGLPISQHRVGTDDARTIRALFDEVAPDADAGESCTTPGEIIDRVAQCRVVVTGAYHAAVYALAHGVPTVCVGRSDYYLDKFRGLRDLFGEGCAVVPLDGPDVAARIVAEIDAQWRAAERHRDGLRAEADRQAAAGAEAFARIAPLLPAPVAHVARSTPRSPALR
jgi:colanic acid/amylovoran biosynthesis protein